METIAVDSSSVIPASPFNFLASLINGNKGYMMPWSPSEISF